LGERRLNRRNEIRRNPTSKEKFKAFIGKEAGVTNRLVSIPQGKKTAFYNGPAK
jgi:hypothetical protein